MNSKFTNDKLVPNGDKVLLRFGLTETRNNDHSFLACLADIYSLKHTEVVDDEELRKILADKVTLDLYVSLHNGSIASIFQPEEKRKVDINKYTNTELYKYIDYCFINKDDEWYNKKYFLLFLAGSGYIILSNRPQKIVGDKLYDKVFCIDGIYRNITSYL